MIRRSFKPLKSQSFFIFGARGVGKSTYLKTQFLNEVIGKNETVHTINLLEVATFNRYFNNPDQLYNDLIIIKPLPKWVIVDEVQKIPKILDVVHRLIEEHKLKFVLTGSSARKLKRGAANLLAGRAFSYSLHPFTVNELKNTFNLESALNWGTLPQILDLDSVSKAEFLRSYALTYLKEEVLEELLIRNQFAFRNFLKIAGQENGNLLNFNKLSRDLNLDPKTIESYFQILEDTLVGFFLPSYHKSIRKSVGQKPKFYLFDLGLKRALDETLDVPLRPQTSAFGKAFEHFLICEIYRMNSYSRKDYSLFQFHTTAGGEIDLILTKSQKVIAVEIKSASKIDQVSVAKFEKISKGIKADALYYVSQDTYKAKIGHVECLYWADFLDELFE